MIYRLSPTLTGKRPRQSFRDELLQ